MKLSLACLSLATFYPIVHGYTYGLGKSWIIGSGSKSNILKVSTTFNPGEPPSDQGGSLKLYPGLSNGTGDLLMTSLESWGDQSWCGGTAGQWCIRTQVFSHQRSTFGKFAPLNGNTPITIVFERAANGSGWTQSVSVNNKVVSQLTFASGPLTLFGVTTECGDACAMTVSPQIYTNTTIELAAPDFTWSSTAITASQIYGDGTYDIIGQQPTVVDGLSSKDGKIWTVDKILTPAFN